MLRTIATTSLLATAAVAQVASPLQLAGLALNYLSAECQQAVVQLANSSNPVYQCLQIDSLIPALTTNDSIIPPVDDYLSAVCYNSPCNATLLNYTASAVIESCSTDLANFGIANETVYDVIGFYPLARDVVCLKNNQTEYLTNATIPLNSTAYNSTNGTFCLTELATNITGYLGVNLTNAYVDTLVLGGNVSALRAVEMLPPTALCSDCIFGAVDLVEEAYPEFGRIIVSQQMGYNVTINDALDGLCAPEGLNVTMMLPEGIIEVAKNGTNATTTVFPSVTGNPFGLQFASASASMSGSMSMTSMMSMTTPSASAATASGIASAVGMPPVVSAPSAAASLVGRMAEKRRWVGQQ